MRLQIEHRMDTAKEQMEHHLSDGKDAMSHFYLPPSILAVAALLTSMLPVNIRSVVNLIPDMSLRSVEREARKAVVMEKSTGHLTKHLSEFSAECFETWSLEVVGVKLKVTACF